MRVVIYSGSFDPVHRGHLSLAKYVASLPNVDEVWMLPSPRNPLKPQSAVASDFQRLEMLSLAVEDMENIKTCDVELTLPKPSYTWNTLNALKQKNPDIEFKLLVGADNWHLFSKWYKGDEIISRFGLYVYPRPGYTLESTAVDNVIFLNDAPQDDVSSTFIRKCLSHGEEIGDMLPKNIKEYINKKRLYK
jgi:nicotinate-nucleotide adenylyltransferase